MKTKPFLLATAGSTIDGRTIEPTELTEMASSYDTATYTALINLEHIAGVSPDAPFQNYGHVVSLSTAEVDVNFNGKTEKRLGLFGVLDILPNAKKLNDAGQKLFPSIQIRRNFAGKGFSYLDGLAFTNTPASIATEQLKFNRTLPGSESFSAQDFGIAAAVLEFEEAAPDANAEAGGFLKSFAAFFDRITPPAPEAKPEVKPENPGDFATQAKPLFENFAKSLDETLGKMAAATTAQVAALSAEVKGLKDQIDTTADPNHHKRPAHIGKPGVDLSKVF